MIYSVFKKGSQHMTYKFILVNTKINPTREQISTIDRKFGDEFLQDNLGRMAPVYSGYIIMPNHTCLCAQWILSSGAVGPLKVAIEKLRHTGYQGEIWQNISDFDKQESIRIV